ncbi:MAG TPA: hypothetical protein VN043_14385 [Rhodanobacter sp.]|nr:hypothetical protein [Rhodanobacter sp.]
MPSAVDFQTKAAAKALTAAYVVLVQEHLGVLAPAVAADTRQQLAAATYTLHFTVGTVAGTRTLVCADIYTAARMGSLPLYFLPWCQNAATEMTLPAGGAGPGIFMTSMLSGCTVQVHGTAASPTITHANASAKYNTAYQHQETVLTKFLSKDAISPQETHDFSEARADSVATGAINAMLPAVVGLSGTTRKSNYAGKVNSTNLVAARRRFIGSLAMNQSLGKFDVATMKLKPKTGAFVFGVRDAAHNWAFYYQSAVEVEIVVQDKFGGGPDQMFTMESAVLGQPEKIFP